MEDLEIQVESSDTEDHEMQVESNIIEDLEMQVESSDMEDHETQVETPESWLVRALKSEGNINFVEREDDSDFFQRRIYKVRYSLKRVNELEYEPLMLSIGPYHHGTEERFQDMENYKEHYLQLLCDREKISQHWFEEVIRDMEQQVRASYASSHRPFESDEYVRMMLLDGCFVVELFRRIENTRLQITDMRSPIFKINFFLPQLFRDMLLFENQIPLCVLNKLFELTEGGDERGDFVDLAVRCIQSFLQKPQVDYDPNSKHILRKSPHLLGLAYLIYVLPFPTKPSYFGRDFEMIRSVTELQEAGVEFKIVESEDRDKGFGAVRFDGGVLETPNLRINDNSESLIRNLIAFEQYSELGFNHRVQDYFIFMSCLVNTPKDVELLRHAGIVSNELGNDEKATRMINDLESSVSYNKRTFYYAQEFEKINLHCAKKKNVWKAKLKREYFNTPWAPISAFAAFILLLLTIIQTILSLLSYVAPKS